MVKDLREYFIENKVEHLYELFVKCGIDEPQLIAKLKYADIEKIGIDKLIEKRRVLDIVNEIGQDLYAEEDTIRNGSVEEQRSSYAPNYSEGVEMDSDYHLLGRISLGTLEKEKRDRISSQLAEKIGTVGVAVEDETSQHPSDIFRRSSTSLFDRQPNNPVITRNPFEKYKHESPSFDLMHEGIEDNFQTEKNIIGPLSDSSLISGRGVSSNILSDRVAIDVASSNQSQPYKQVIHTREQPSPRNSAFKGTHHTGHVSHPWGGNGPSPQRSEPEHNACIRQKGNTTQRDLTLSNSPRTSEGSNKDTKITVIVRKRPVMQIEKDIVDIQNKTIIVKEPRLKLNLEPYTELHKFAFDFSFPETVKNHELYSTAVRDVIEHVINGGNGSIIAYGQTGTGKTYTMLEKDIGMLYLALKDLMCSKKAGVMSFCEIYLGQVNDLFTQGERVVLREVAGVVHLTNSREEKFTSYEEACRLIDIGMAHRKTGVTGANTKSSRSHAIIIVKFLDQSQSYISKKEVDDKYSGSIIFVDLAGSERGSDRKDLSSELRNEGAEINKSLLALKECIRGIEQDKKHLPFRQSKLTQLLKNSFVGSSKTCLIATFSPLSDNAEHTLNTLRYAARIKDFDKIDQTDDISGQSFIETPTKEARRSEKWMGSKEGVHVSSPRATNETKKEIISKINTVLSSIQSSIPYIHGIDDLKKVLEICKDLEKQILT